MNKLFIVFGIVCLVACVNNVPEKTTLNQKQPCDALLMQLQAGQLLKGLSEIEWGNESIDMDGKITVFQLNESPRVVDFQAQIIPLKDKIIFENIDRDGQKKEVMSLACKLQKGYHQMSVLFYTADGKVYYSISHNLELNQGFPDRCLKYNLPTGKLTTCKVGE